MNFIKRIKQELDDPRNCNGRREKVLVDHRALLELIDHYETLDAMQRALSMRNQRAELYHLLDETIISAYHQQGKNSETTLMRIMDTLRPLMEERHRKRFYEPR